jgi:hypothetical protein
MNRIHDLDWKECSIGRHLGKFTQRRTLARGKMYRRQSLVRRSLLDETPDTVNHVTHVCEIKSVLTALHKHPTAACRHSGERHRNSGLVIKGAAVDVREAANVG